MKLYKIQLDKEPPADVVIEGADWDMIESIRHGLELDTGREVREIERRVEELGGTVKVLRDVDIPSELSIASYMHCSQCIEEWKAEHSGKMSPREYAQLEVGFTREGLQVWCKRHERNVVHIHFERCRHPANFK